MLELTAFEVAATDIKVGDTIQYMEPTLSGSKRRESKVASVEIETCTDYRMSEEYVQVMLESGHALDYGMADYTVVHRMD